MTSIAVMQPYIFPYLGYFQLINSVDKFIFYDDVNFIKNGWINRNRILINGEAQYFTIPCKDVSSYKKIKDIEHRLTPHKKDKLLKQVRFAYGRAPFFEQVYNIVKQVLEIKTNYISEIAIYSVEKCSAYMGLECSFSKSSETYNNEEFSAANRLIDICKQERINNYINPVGGRKLYSKKYFSQSGIKLQFLEPVLQKYEQFGSNFTPGLSIIDVMMFNPPEKIKHTLLSKYNLV